MKKYTLTVLVLAIIAVLVLANAPADAQIQPLFGGAQQKVVAMPATVTIWGNVADEWGNPLAGLGWPMVKMSLYQELRLANGKIGWTLVAETACDRYGWGNGCPDQYNGYYQFVHNQWGGDLYPGRYQIEVKAKGFGATRSRTFYANGQWGPSFNLTRLEAYVWVNTDKSEVVGDKVTLSLSTYGSDDQDVSVLFDVQAVAQSATNDEEKALELSPKTVVRPVTLARSLQSTWKVTRTFPELAEVAPGTRVCFSVTLRYEGYEDWVAGKLTDPVCFAKSRSVMAPTPTWGWQPIW